MEEGLGRVTSERRPRQPVRWYEEFSPRRFSNLEALYNRRSFVLCFKLFFSQCLSERNSTNFAV